MPGLTSHSKKNMVSESESESVFWGCTGTTQFSRMKKKKKNVLSHQPLPSLVFTFGF